MSEDATPKWIEVVLRDLREIQATAGRVESAFYLRRKEPTEPEMKVIGEMVAIATSGVRTAEREVKLALSNWREEVKKTESEAKAKAVEALKKAEAEAMKP